MIYALYFVHILISIFLVLVVLLQQGKGADLSVFGGGTTQAAFGARGAATVLHKLTVICFVLFIVTTLSIGILQSQRAPSVMGGLETEETATEASEAPTSPPGGELPVDVSGEASAESEAAPPPVESGDGPAVEDSSGTSSGPGNEGSSS